MLSLLLCAGWRSPRVKVETFTLERWMSTWETVAKFDIAESGIFPLTTRELLDFLPADDRQAVEDTLLDLRLGYTEARGTARLRADLAATYADVNPEQILVTTGAIEANYLLVNTLLEAGDHVVSVLPAYQQLYSVAKAVGCDISLWNIVEDGGNYRFDLDELERLVKPETKMILINTPNNPTGAVYSRESLEAIAKLCVEHDLWLLSDEVYWTLGGGHHVSPRALPGMAERTLVINSMSKSHGMTGWRMGWLTGSESMIALLVSLNLVTTYGLTGFIQEAAAEALENDYGVKEIADTYNGRRKVFLDAIKGLNDITVRGSEGGMYVMLDISAVEPDDEKFAWAFLDAENVSVMPGSSFGDAAAGHIRISLCQPDEVLLEAAARLRRFASSYRSKAA
jgi:arginine:pyruvate transaminase